MALFSSNHAILTDANCVSTVHFGSEKIDAERRRDASVSATAAASRSILYSHVDVQT